MYYNPETKEQIKHQQLMNLYNTSFPSTKEVFNGWYLLHQQDIPSFNPDYQDLSDGPITLIDGKYYKTWKVTDRDLSIIIEETKVKISDKVQERLDNFAKTRNYDNIFTACTYSNSTNEKFKIEGTYCVSSRDNTWNKYYELLDEILPTITKPEDIPSWETIESQLPELVWPNNQ